MLRFFESEVDSWWSMAATPPPPPCHYVELPVDTRFQVRDHYSESGTAPPMNIAPACRRVASALTTVDLVKGRWSPATIVSNGSSLSSPNSSSSVDSMNSYGGCGIISWQSSNAFSIESAIDPHNIAPFKVEDRSSPVAKDSGRRNQHEVMVDLRQHRRKLDENKNIEAVLRDSKRQKSVGVQEGNLHCFTSFESTSSSPSMMMTAQQNLKATMKRSQKLGDKITALQQLVSPFGKADTASVLHEAAVYIKALHEQVKLLSKPYVESISSPEGIQGMKNGAENCHYGSSRLRREGLCMVPISASIISLANHGLLDSHMAESLLR